MNQGWIALLYSAGKATAELLGLAPDCGSGPHAGGLDPAIDQGIVEFLSTGAVSPDTLDFLATSSLTAYGRQRPVTVPTLVMQGSVDTLFDLTDGYGVYEHVRDQGVDARFVAFCGGHVACPAGYVDAGDRAHLDDAIVAWFARHLRGEDVETGSPIEYRTNEGVWRATTSFPAPGSDDVAFEGDAESLAVVPVVDLPDLEELQKLIAPPEGIPALPVTSSVPTPEGDPRGSTFPVLAAEHGPLELFGIPEVSLTVSGRTVPLDQVLSRFSDGLDEAEALDRVGDLLVGDLGPFGGIVAGLGGASQLGGLSTPTAHVFVKFVHRETGEVVSLQEGAVSVALTEDEVTVDVPMPGLAYTLPEGDHLDVQVATNSLMHATGRAPALIDVRLDGSIPVLAAGAADGDGDGDDGAGDLDSGADGDEAERPGPDRGAGDTPRGHGQDAGGRTTAAATTPLPVTGGTAVGSALAALLAAAALRRRGRHVE